MQLLDQSFRFTLVLVWFLAVSGIVIAEEKQANPKRTPFQAELGDVIYLSAMTGVK